VNWLIENRPPEPEHLAVCHGDFHALNILIQDGKVTGVLDWPGFIIADPAFDVANTVVLTTIPSKHISASMDGFSSVDWEMAAQLYLDAYRTHSPLDGEHLDYYRVRRCVDALIQGFDGQKIWQQPLIVKDLIEYIQKITDLEITMPS
jgi:aminoglycoside phosphotransferase (APT) family kinase protein